MTKWDHTPLEWVVLDEGRAEVRHVWKCLVSSESSGGGPYSYAHIVLYPDDWHDPHGLVRAIYTRRSDVSPRKGLSSSWYLHKGVCDAPIPLEVAKMYAMCNSPELTSDLLSVLESYFV